MTKDFSILDMVLPYVGASRTNPACYFAAGRMLGWIVCSRNKLVSHQVKKTKFEPAFYHEVEMNR